MELQIAELLKSRKVKFSYETLKIKYVVPSRVATYTPDFILADGRILEIKGRLTAADRKKLVAVKEENPSINIVLVFQRPRNTIYKGSSTTCEEWAIGAGFECIDVKELENWL